MIGVSVSYEERLQWIEVDLESSHGSGGSLSAIEEEGSPLRLEQIGGVRFMARGHPGGTADYHQFIHSCRELLQSETEAKSSVFREVNPVLS